MERTITHTGNHTLNRKLFSSMFCHVWGLNWTENTDSTSRRRSLKSRIELTESCSRNATRNAARGEGQSQEWPRWVQKDFVIVAISFNGLPCLFPEQELWRGGAGRQVGFQSGWVRGGEWAGRWASNKYLLLPVWGLSGKLTNGWLWWPNFLRMQRSGWAAVQDWLCTGN